MVSIKNDGAILGWCYFMVILPCGCAIAWSFCLWWRCRMALLFMVCYRMAMLFYGGAIVRWRYFTAVLSYVGAVLWWCYRVIFYGCVIRVIVLFYGDSIVW